MTTVAEILKQARTSKGLTLTDVSKATGIGLTTINAWERGASRPRSANRRKIAKFYAIHEQSLIGISNPRSSVPHETVPMIENYEYRPLFAHKKTWAAAEALMPRYHAHDLSMLFTALVNDASAGPTAGSHSIREER